MPQEVSNNLPRSRFPHSKTVRLVPAGNRDREKRLNNANFRDSGVDQVPGDNVALNLHPGLPETSAIMQPSSSRLSRRLIKSVALSWSHGQRLTRVHGRGTRGRSEGGNRCRGNWRLEWHRAIDLRRRNEERGLDCVLAIELNSTEKWFCFFSYQEFASSSACAMPRILLPFALFQCHFRKYDGVLGKFLLTALLIWIVR